MSPLREAISPLRFAPGGQTVMVEPPSAVVARGSTAGAGRHGSWMVGERPSRVSPARWDRPREPGGPGDGRHLRTGGVRQWTTTTTTTS